MSRMSKMGKMGTMGTMTMTKMMKSTRTKDATVIAALALLFAAGCATNDGMKYEKDSRTDTMTMAEMRMDEAGGPAPAAKPAGVKNPVSAPDAPPPSPRALSDAGPNTPLGKQWIFTEIPGYQGTLTTTGPYNASFVMARESGRLSGSTSCNAMSGSFDINISAGTLRFKNLENGSALCTGTNARTQEAVIGAMVATDGFLLDGSNLSLLSKGSVVAQLTTP